MEKIDRLGWADGMCFTSYGMRIGVRVNDPELMPRIWPLLPPGWKPTRTPIVDLIFSLRRGGASRAANVRRLNLMYTGSAQTGRTADIEDLLEGFERDLHMYMASWSPKHVFVHAGVVGWKGRAIVVPGSSFSGKTTLVSALVRAGATYYSDEYAVFDSDGRVHPFARPLQIRQPGEAKPKKCSPAELGGKAGRQPLPVGLVAVTEYAAGANWRPRPVSPGKAVLELISHAVPVRYRPTATMATLPRVVASAVVLKGRRGEAEQAARAMLERLG